MQIFYSREMGMMVFPGLFPAPSSGGAAGETPTAIETGVTPACYSPPHCRLFTFPQGDARF